MREFSHQYRDLLLDLPFQVPQNLIYVVRTVAILSGMCTGLDPDVNLWTQVGPYAQRLVADEATSGLSHWIDEIGDALLAGLALPGQASRVLARTESTGLPVRDEHVGREVRRLGRAVDRLAGAVVAAGLLVAGAVLVSGGDDGLGVGLFAAAGAVVLGVLVGGGRR